MRKSIELTNETLQNVVENKKKVPGLLFVDPATGKMTFKAFNRSARKPDRLICETESGWLKQSKTRIKFFSSQKCCLGSTTIERAMTRDLTESMDVLRSQRIIKNL